MFQGQQVRGSQVGDVNVVAHRRAVGSRVIAAEDRNVRPLTFRRCQHNRDQVGLRLVIFAERFGGAGSVEITQRDELHPVGAVIAFKHALDEELRPAVRIDGVLRVLFVERHVLRLAVGGAGRREDELPHPGFLERAKQLDALLDVVLVITRRMFDRFANVSQGREVDAGFDGVRLCDLLYKCAVADMAFIKRRILGNCLTIAARQVVEYDNRFPLCSQRLDRDAADIARAARD